MASVISYLLGARMSSIYVLMRYACWNIFLVSGALSRGVEV